ncbi:Glutamate--tRNA ligase [compost metagenome]
MVSASDIVELSEMFFRTDLSLDEEGVAILAEEQVNTVLSTFLGKVEELAEFTPENIAARIKEVQKETGVKGKGLFMPIRVALTGQTHGRDLNQTIFLLGRDRTIQRLKAQIK